MRSLPSSFIEIWLVFSSFIVGGGGEGGEGGGEMLGTIIFAFVNLKSCCINMLR